MLLGAACSGGPDHADQAKAERDLGPELVANGGAALISQESPELILDAAFSLMANDTERATMASKAGATGHRNASAEVARRALELAGG